MTAPSAVHAPSEAGPGQIVARDPASGEELGAVPITTPADVEQVVAAVAAVRPLWSLLRARDRARYLRRAAQALIDERERVIETIAREQGRTRAEVAVLEVLPALDAVRIAAASGTRALAGRPVAMPPSRFPLGRARLAHEPLGTIAVVSARSAPFAAPFGQIASALMAGNGAVLKPAPRAALASEAIARVLGRAGLPEGLVRVIHGGPATGAALAAAEVELVLLGGSTATARATQATRARDVARALAGKDAMVVLDDANLALAARCALAGAIAGAGQAQGAIGHVHVAADAHEAFVRLLVARCQALRVGDPRAPGTQVGPLASHARLREAGDLVASAVAEGAQLRCGGPLEHPAAAGQPAYFAPAVLTRVTPAMALAREPVHAPVLAISAFSSLDDALALIAAQPPSPGASVWGADRYRALRVARELGASAVWVNDHLPASAALAFVRSRRGQLRAHGRMLYAGRTEASVRDLASNKLIAHRPASVPNPWWGPHDERHERAASALMLWRSARRSDRERAAKQAAIALARVGAYALRGR